MQSLTRTIYLSAIGGSGSHTDDYVDNDHSSNECYELSADLDIDLDLKHDIDCAQNTDNITDSGTESYSRYTHVNSSTDTPTDRKYSDGGVSFTVGGPPEKSTADDNFVSHSDLPYGSTYSCTPPVSATHSMFMSGGMYESSNPSLARERFCVHMRKYIKIYIGACIVLFAVQFANIFVSDNIASKILSIICAVFVFICVGYLEKMRREWIRHI